MILFIAIWSLWFVSEILLNRLLRSGSDDRKDQDKKTLGLIWRLIGLANSMGILFVIFIRMPISTSWLLPYSGLGLIIIGMVIRFAAIISLGRFFTVDVTIRQDHRIKKDGIYSLIRHPSYLGSILSFIGFGLSLNNWLSLPVIVIPVTMAMLYRIRIEEKVLLDRFGQEYAEYKNDTCSLIPYIY
jgi:protein-S-isoprenylcysteine O-methyltransferase Ste14